MKNITSTFEVIVNSNKKLIEIEQNSTFGKFNKHIRFSAFGVPCDFSIIENRKCLVICDHYTKKVYGELCDFFAIKLKNNVRTCITLTDESWDLVQAKIEEYNTEYSLFITDFNDRASKQPMWYGVYENFYMDDYKSGTDRIITVYRKPLEEDNTTSDIVTHTTYDFSDDNIGSYIDEWKKDFNEIIEKKLNDSKISEELFIKWIDIYEKIKQEKVIKQEKIEQKRQEKTDAEKQRVLDCELEAKKTNKRVEVYNVFLMGNDIPKKYRTEDSDMGSLVTYVNPDGTYEEIFNHSY